MTHSVVVSEDAAGEIHRNAQWWAANRSAEQAGRWYDGIRNVIELLGDRPDQWPLARETVAFPFELRERHFGLSSRPTHRILFTIRAGRVIIIAVRGGAQEDLQPGDIAPF